MGAEILSTHNLCVESGQALYWFIAGTGVAAESFFVGFPSRKLENLNHAPSVGLAAREGRRLASGDARARCGS